MFCIIIIAVDYIRLQHLQFFRYEHQLEILRCLRRNRLSNCAWRLNNKYGIAYMEEKKLADEILGLEGRYSRNGDTLMAIYLSPGGKIFAWQVVFETKNWEQVLNKLGIQYVVKKAVSSRKPREQKKDSITKTRQKSHDKQKCTSRKK